MRLKRRNARDELGAFYWQAKYAYERGYLECKQAKRPALFRSIAYAEPESIAYKAGWDAAKTDGSATMGDDVYVAALVRWVQ